MLAGEPPDRSSWSGVAEPARGPYLHGLEGDREKPPNVIRPCGPTPQPPPPGFRARPPDPARDCSSNMIPARSGRPTPDGWCLRSPTSVRYGCDMVNPLRDRMNTGTGHRYAELFVSRLIRTHGLEERGGTSGAMVRVFHPIRLPCLPVGFAWTLRRAPGRGKEPALPGPKAIRARERSRSNARPGACHPGTGRTPPGKG